MRGNQRFITSLESDQEGIGRGGRFVGKAPRQRGRRVNDEGRH